MYVKSIGLALAVGLGVVLGSAAIEARAAGAIAVDDEDGVAAKDIGYGVGSGSTRDEAGKNALAECKSAGNGNCHIAVRYDQCGAYAASSSNYGVGWGPTLKIAESKAKEACGAGCGIAVSDCDE